MRAGGPSGARIRVARSTDLDALLALETEAFATDRLDRRALRHAIASPTIVALVADGDGPDLAGYALVQLRRGSTAGRLTSLAVARTAARTGIGRDLVRAAEAASLAAGCTCLRLEVRADNAAARRLYEGTGFAHAGTMADYYEDGEAAVRYERALS